MTKNKGKSVYNPLCRKGNGRMEDIDMSKRFLKSVLVQTAGAFAARISVYGFNPIGIGMFTAIMSSRLIKWPTIFVMAGSMLFYWDIMDTVKYTLVMAAACALMAMARDKNSRVNQVTGAVIGAGLYGIMEATDKIMAGGGGADYSIIAVVAVLTFSSSIVISKIIEALTVSGRKMDRDKDRHLEKSVDNMYEEKIKMIASSFEKISKYITTMNRTSRENAAEDSINCIACSDMTVSQTDMINEIWRGRMMESRNAIALQLGEMSKILKDCTSSSYVFVHMSEERERYLRLKLKNMGLSVKKVVVLNNRRGINEVNITLKTVKSRCITVRELESAISDCFGKRYRVSKDKGNIVKREYATYNFVEEPNYFVLHGTAKRGKDGSSISGDNFTCMELQSGQTLLSVSDGMGHGLKAYRESEMVLSLLEELMEGGFSEEASLKLINTVFMVDDSDICPASVDMGIIDLYSGVCDFMKIGAATTFVKRGGWIEAIRSNTMPIGAEASVDMETTSKKLYDGDFVIMVSDGIVEAIEGEDKEKSISRILMDISSVNPQEMAQEILENILKQSGSREEDDMLVMVAGVWDKCA